MENFNPATADTIGTVKHEIPAEMAGLSKLASLRHYFTNIRSNRRKEPFTTSAVHDRGHRMTAGPGKCLVNAVALALGSCRNSACQA